MKQLIFFSKRVVLLMFFLCISFLSIAQPIDPLDPNCDPLDPGCPIDDYYGVFIFAIVLIAAYKAYKRKSTTLQSLEK